MDIQNLAERLRDPDPRIRVETLRILAMVEETRALDAIRWIYLNDPEPGVRDVANWAGNLIWQAEQRGHSTQRAIEEMFEQPLSAEREKLFLKELTFQRPAWGRRGLVLQKLQAELDYRRQLDDLLQGGADEPDSGQDPALRGVDEEPLALPESTGLDDHPAQPDLDDLDALIDAGWADADLSLE
jgi:hypothetical protein